MLETYTAMTFSTSRNSKETSTPLEGGPDFFGVLSHTIRLQILFLLYENIEMTYTQILKALDVDPGLLNFHLRKIKDLVEQTEEGSYTLSDPGKIACETWDFARERLERRYSKRLEPFEPPRLTTSLVLRRIGAFVIDAALLFFSTLLFLDTNFWSAVTDLVSLQLSFEMVGRFSYEVVVHYSVVFFAAYIMFTILEAYKGQTLGKYVLGIRLTKTDGRRVQLLDSAVRNIGKIFLLPLDLLLGVAVYSDRGYLRFFDYYTRTMIEELG